ncbi:uncharacterized protein CLUP02_05239 [Colletotrichum lupini]|uniref:Secreted protein n=1 Tax=Colletotrichum lupini TaxID=145971 RepID=A0A9Q8SLT4_9PEZI|nr:uncharacterized protein CLUP02_05239 [Colletotrichum lupini]UQC79759.1 hypothetical protein CLUP02_05239 [Colletotrichum lupini]
MSFLWVCGWVSLSNGLNVVVVLSGGCAAYWKPINAVNWPVHLVPQFAGKTARAKLRRTENETLAGIHSNGIITNQSGYPPYR